MLGRTRIGLLLLTVCLVSSASRVPVSAGGEGIVAVVHDRGTRVRFEGDQAAELARLCEELVRRCTSTSGGIDTENIRYDRSAEVAVEIRFPAPKAIQPACREKVTEPQYLFVALTGEGTGRSGNEAQVNAGRHAPPDPVEALAPFFDYSNKPDEYRIQYFTTFHAKDALDPLRQAVVGLGFDAPRSTPRPPNTPLPPREFPTLPLEEEDGPLPSPTPPEGAIRAE